jgi:hypothetical protein
MLPRGFYNELELFSEAAGPNQHDECGRQKSRRSLRSGSEKQYHAVKEIPVSSTAHPISSRTADLHQSVRKPHLRPVDNAISEPLD